jgi:hypothetical protein
VRQVNIKTLRPALLWKKLVISLTDQEASFTLAGYNPPIGKALRTMTGSTWGRFVDLARAL